MPRYGLPPERPTRILILKLDHIGDMLIGMPALQEIRAAWPDADITLVCSPTNAPLAAKFGIVDTILSYRFFEDRSEVQRSPDDVLAERFRGLRLPAFDIALDLRFGDETRFLLDLVEAKYTCGYFTRRIGRKLDISVQLPEVQPRKKPDAPKALHDEARLMLLARTLIDAFQHRPHPLLAVPSGLHEIPFAGAAYAVIGPTAGAEIKQWPNESFAAVGRALLKKGISIVLVGDRMSQADCREIAEGIAAEGVRDLSGKLPIEELATVLRHAHLFIGNDSAPGHMAAALDVPTVIVFSGAVNIDVWHPRGINAVALQADIDCSPCYLTKKTDCPNERRCLTGIGPEYVVDTALELRRIATSRERLSRPILDEAALS